MFPDVRFLTLDLYAWMVLVGVIAAMVVFRVFSGRAGLSAKVYNFSLLVGACSVIVGYLSALLFESWYEYLETGVFEWGTGATFYGGLIGAAVCFLALYFGLGALLFKDGAHAAQFNRMLSLIAPCIVLAHAFGRIGCLFAGCCYGKLTDGPFGVAMRVHGEWQRRVPIQLFESLFLFVLSGVLFFLVWKKRCQYTAGIYLAVYAVWRFFIEFARDDDRGVSGLAGVTPSQLTAIVLFLVGVAWSLLYRYLLKRKFDGALAKQSPGQRI